MAEPTAPEVKRLALELFPARNSRTFPDFLPQPPSLHTIAPQPLRLGTYISRLESAVKLVGGWGELWKKAAEAIIAALSVQYWSGGTKV